MLILGTYKMLVDCFDIQYVHVIRIIILSTSTSSGNDACFSRDTHPCGWLASEKTGRDQEQHLPEHLCSR